MKCKVEHEDAERVIAFFDDFDGFVDDWKAAWYELWRYQMTWGFAHEMMLRESRTNGVYVDMLIKPVYLSSLLELMENLRFREIINRNESVGLVDDETEDCFTWEGMY